MKNYLALLPAKQTHFSAATGTDHASAGNMSRLLDDLRLLEAAQGYATLGLHMRANQELEQMSPGTRHWPEVLAVKLAIFDGLKLWEMVEIVAMQLRDSARGNPQWTRLAEKAWQETRTARQRERRGSRAETAAPALGST
jgi:hypothetical protein